MRRSASPWGTGLLLSMLIAGAAHAEPRKPTHIACVGDSITAGAGASSTAKNYVSQLQTLLGSGVQVKNFGNSGSTLLGPGYGDKPYVQQAEYAAATTFVNGAGANAVVSVVIMLGTNDSKPFNWQPSGKPKNDQRFVTDYKALIDHFQSLSTKPTVYVVYPLAAYVNPFSIRGSVIKDEQVTLIHRVAVDKHVPVIDLNAPTLNHPEYFDDGVHPNDKGYAAMASLVKQGLAREPSVDVTSPAKGATVGVGTLSLGADASADTVDITAVEFFEGQASLGKANAKPFSVTWTPSAGPHTITAKATDATLANATSDPVSFTVVAGGGTGSGGVGQSGSTGTAGAGQAGGGATSGGGGSATASGGAGGRVGVEGGSGGSLAQGGTRAGANQGGSAGASGTAPIDPSLPSAAPGNESSCSCGVRRRQCGSREAGALLLVFAAVSARRWSNRRKLAAPSRCRE